MHFFNSLTKQKEKFNPIEDNLVRIYTCGPTVYNYAHIGNLRAFIFADILQRSLKFAGYQIKWVMNITDVDDKTVRDSKKKYPNLEPMEALKKFTKFYEDIFWQNLSALNIEKPQFTPRASEVIAEIQKIINSIAQNGFTYKKDGSVYFNLEKYLEKYHYGWLVKLNFSQMRPSGRIDQDEYKLKENIADFVLWKAKKENEPSWNFDFQGENLPGRPGWHIECSTISHQYLKFPFDIHTGGTDLKFPHHENEIAQNTAAFGIKKPINFFLHNEHVLINNQKMSKSLRNFYTLQDLQEKNFSPLDYRYLCLGTHYRKKMNFSWTALTAARNSRLELIDFLQRALSNSTNNQNHQENSQEVENYQRIFLAAIEDDLNIPEGLAIVWQIIKDNNLHEKTKIDLLLDFDQVLGLNLLTAIQEKIPEEIKSLIREREKYRQEKNWGKADEVRAKIEKAGYQIEDTKKESRVIKKS